MNTIVTSDTILAIFINPRDDSDTVDVEYAVGSNRDTAINALMTYLITGIEDRNPLIGQLAEIIISAVEGIKKELPEIAAMVRRMNIEHLKNKQDESENKTL